MEAANPSAPPRGSCHPAAHRSARTSWGRPVPRARHRRAPAVCHPL